MTGNRWSRIGLVLGVALGSVCAQEDVSTWAHMRVLTLNTTSSGGGAGVNAAMAGFPVLVRLTASQSDVFAQSKTGGADLRFRRVSGQNLPYQIERWDSAGQSALIWVRLDSVKASATQSFNMYWGKSSAGAASSGPGTFDTAGGYQGVWHFAASLNDATANAINGTDEATTDAAGAVGQGRAFNGSARVVLGNPAKMSSGDADRYTVEAWVNWTSIGTTQTDRYRCIINHGTTNNADQFFMYARNPSAGGTDPYYSVGYYTGTVSNNATLYGIATDAGAWVHVAGVYDGTEWRVYRNGVLGGSLAKDGSPVNAAQDWVIGAWGTSRNFLGSLDEIRFSNRVRSDAWIKLAYETQKGGATALTVGPTVAPSSVAGATRASGAGFEARATSRGVVFRLPSGSGRARLAVAGVDGRTVWSREVDLGEAATELAADLALAPGAYAASLRIAGVSGARIAHRTFAIAP